MSCRMRQEARIKDVSTVHIDKNDQTIS